MTRHWRQAVAGGIGALVVVGAAVALRPAPQSRPLSPSPVWTDTRGVSLLHVDARVQLLSEGRTPAPTAAISFVSPVVGYGLGAAGDRGAILRTADGGALWTVVGHLPNGAAAGSGPDLLAFTDAQRGWAVTDQHTLVRTPMAA